MSIINRCWIAGLSLAVTQKEMLIETILCHVIWIRAQPQLHVPHMMCSYNHFHIHQVTRLVRARNRMRDRCKVGGTMPATNILVAIVAVAIETLWIPKVALVGVAT
jgi:hypothetical protein